MEFDVGDFVAQKRLWNVAKKRMLEDRGALVNEDCNPLRECKAVHEGNFLIGLL